MLPKVGRYNKIKHFVYLYHSIKNLTILLILKQRLYQLIIHVQLSSTKKKMQIYTEYLCTY